MQCAYTSHTTASLSSWVSFGPLTPGTRPPTSVQEGGPLRDLAPLCPHGPTWGPRPLKTFAGCGVTQGAPVHTHPQHRSEHPHHRSHAHGQSWLAWEWGRGCDSWGFLSLRLPRTRATTTTLVTQQGVLPGLLSLAVTVGGGLWLP